MSKSKETKTIEEIVKSKVMTPYIYTSKVVNDFIMRAESQKRISKDTIREDVTKIFDYIRYFNSLDEDVTFIKGHHISEWPILNEFKDFIMPNSVRYESGNKLFVDLIMFKPTCDDSKLSWNEYINTISRFRNNFKKDALSDKVSLDSLRVDKSFENIRNIASWFNGSYIVCRYIGDPFIPVCIKGINEFVGDVYDTAIDDIVVSDYISKLFF